MDISNPQKRLKLLFFTPYGGRTGSEMMLINLLKYIDTAKFEVRLFSMKNGEFLKELPTSIKCYYDESELSVVKRVFEKLKKKLKIRSSLEKRLITINHEFKPDLWYLNTLILTPVVNIAIKHKIKFAIHFHELLSQYSYINYADLNRAVHFSSFTVGCCNAVCENLKILGSKVILKQPECIDVSLIVTNKDDKINIKKKNKIAENTQVIIMSGQRIERKGYDLFIKVAQQLRNEEFFFVWIGSKKDSGYEFFMDQYITHHKMENILILHPSNNDYYNYLDCADIFFLSSVEDPFPLVMLEANYLGKYIVALNSGGAAEFIKPSMGHVIYSWNIEDITNELKEQCLLIKHKESKDRYSLEFDVKTQVKHFEKLIENEISKT